MDSLSLCFLRYHATTLPGLFEKRERDLQCNEWVRYRRDIPRVVRSGNASEFSGVDSMITNNCGVLAYRLSALVAFNGEAHCCSCVCGSEG